MTLLSSYLLLEGDLFYFFLFGSIYLRRPSISPQLLCCCSSPAVNFVIIPKSHTNYTYLSHILLSFPSDRVFFHTDIIISLRPFPCGTTCDPADPLASLCPC